MFCFLLDDYFKVQISAKVAFTTEQSVFMQKLSMHTNSEFSHAMSAKGIRIAAPTDLGEAKTAH